MHKSNSGKVYKATQAGQGLVEYALILVLVAIVVIVVLALFGPAIGSVYSNVMINLQYPGGGGGYYPTQTSFCSGKPNGTLWVKYEKGGAPDVYAGSGATVPSGYHTDTTGTCH